MSKARIMYEMTVREVREGLQKMKTVIVPIGCTEQHGYHLPLSVDILNAEQIARRASEISGVFVTPTIPYSFSGGMLPGTINLNPHTVSLVLCDIFRSLIEQGFRNIIVLLGHGGSENTQAVNDAASNFQRLNPSTDGVCILVVPFWEVSPTYSKSWEEGDYHAGKYETSMMLYWRPDLVKMDQATLDDKELVDLMRSDPDAYVHKIRAIDSEFVSPKLIQNPAIQVGVMGDPFSASAELGKRIAEESSKGIAALVEKLEKGFSND